MATIDSDAHVIETEETWRFLEGSDRRFMPMIVSQTSGNELRNNESTVMRDYWVINRRIHTRDGNNSVKTTSLESREMRDVEARIRHMDEMEVDFQILYPTLLLRPIADNAPLELALSKSYNRWLVEIWKKGHGRLRWIAVPPLLSLDKIRDELRFAKDHGACGVFMRPLECEKPLSDPYFHSLYEVASELDLAICLHLGNGSFAIHDFYDRDTTFTKFKLPMIGAFHSLILSQTPAKFPKLRWGIIEASANWLPYVISDLKARMAKRDIPVPSNMLGDNRVYVTCEVTDDLPYVLRAAGDDNIVIGTDYGHNDAASEIEALRLLKDVPGIGADAVEKILWNNPRTLYGLG